jgi:hypothetical protein
VDFNSYKINFITIFFICTITISSQDLDPRAYARVPVDATVLIAGFNYSYGDILTDPVLVIKELDANVASPIIGIARTFSLFGLTSQAYVTLPYVWAEASGEVLGEDSSITLSGFGDTRFRISALLFGAPAAKIEEFAKSNPKNVLGVSLTITAPTGQFFSDKLINIGTNRWSFKPEIGLSYILTEQWYIDLYAGAWFFTNNKSFYPGNTVRSQDPLVAFQTHISYKFNRLTWAAFDFTYYFGGKSSVSADDFYYDDRQENMRFGATFNFPISKIDAIKIAASTGAIIRAGADFTTISIAYQRAFY